MSKPILHNIRILDFTWVLAGPYASRFLADYGAEVIKVQPLLPPEETNAFTIGYDQTWNRNKLGITLNLAKPEGIELANKLISISDAVIENFTPHVMVNFGLDYANLKKIKPDIIMVSMTLMGQQSLQSHYTGYAPTVHALSGLTDSMKVEGSPVGPGFSYSDHIAGLYASMSLLVALEHRRQTGEGQYIDVAETAILQAMLKEDNAPPVPENVYLCNDGKWCAVTVDTGEDWDGLRRALERPLNDNAGVDSEIRVWAKAHSGIEVMSKLQNNGIAAGIVQDTEMLANSPQLEARGFFVKHGNPPFIDAPPIKMKNQPFKYKPAPVMGQDNDYVYGKLLGLSKKEIDELQQNGVI